MKNYFLLLFVFISFCSFSQQKVIQDKRQGKYLDKTVIFKIKPDHKSICTANNIANTKIKLLLERISATGLYQKYPFSKPGKSGKNTIDISTIYEITYSADVAIEKVIAHLKQNPDVEYAVPHFIVYPLYTPNDPLIGNEPHLNIIKAYQAWDICKGDTNVVIAISDWGTDNGHEDLMYNVKYNINDPIDGIDNDDDGYIDNFRGWNFGDNNNNPQAGTAGSVPNHGIYVSGISSAQADNGKGVAGVGFKCKFVHLKIADADGNGIGGYESIAYAADHGFGVINCSWGESSDYNAYGQDIIDYAFSKNLLVVAAAGNSNNQVALYPASYNHVLSVAVLENNDAKAGVSSYGSHIGISSPSQSTTTSNINNSYGNTEAYTSFASPVITGCAAIVRSHYPDFNADQVREVLKVTADNIDTIAGNSNYIDLLGSGRVNLYRALTDTLPPSIVFHTYTLIDNNDNWLSQNDTVLITGLFTNFLTPSTNLIASMSCSSSFIQVLGATVNLGVIGTMDTVNNAINPFKIKIQSNTLFDTPVRLKITFTDVTLGYRAVQYVEFVARKSYRDIAPNSISTTITANGNFGYNDYVQLNGIGFRYKNSDPLFLDAGLMFGNSVNSVSSNIRQNNSFNILSGTTLAIPSIVSNEDYLSLFNDNASATSMNVKVIQKVYAWYADSVSDFIMVEYSFINNSLIPLSGMYAGIFADWDISIYNTNKANYNSIFNFSYNYSTMPDGIYTGMKLLSGQQQYHYAIDQTTEGDGIINISILNDFSTAQKYYVLSHNRQTAGGAGSGNDICDVMSAGPFDIAAGDTVKVAFALMAGENLYVLQNAAIAAQSKFDSMYYSINVPLLSDNKNQIRIYPNPVTNTLRIDLQNISGDTEIIIYDALGNKMNNEKSNEKSLVMDCSKWTDGIYFVRVCNNNTSQVQRFVIAR